MSFEQACTLHGGWRHSLCCMYTPQPSARKIAPARSRGPSCLAASAVEGRKLACSWCCGWEEETFEDFASQEYLVGSYQCHLPHRLVARLALSRLWLGLGHLEHPSPSLKRLRLAFPCDWHYHTRCHRIIFPERLVFSPAVATVCNVHNESSSLIPERMQPHTLSAAQTTQWKTKSIHLLNLNMSSDNYQHHIISSKEDLILLERNWPTR